MNLKLLILSWEGKSGLRIYNCIQYLGRSRRATITSFERTKDVKQAHFIYKIFTLFKESPRIWLLVFSLLAKTTSLGFELKIQANILPCTPCAKLWNISIGTEGKSPAHCKIPTWNKHYNIQHKFSNFQSWLLLQKQCFLLWNWHGKEPYARD